MAMITHSKKADHTSEIETISESQAHLLERPGLLLLLLGVVGLVNLNRVVQD